MRTIERTDPLSDTGDAYRYDRFRPKLLLQDLRFSDDALAPGDSLAAYDLPTLDDGTIQIGGDREKPLLLVTGSITCPMTNSSLPVIDALHSEFGEDKYRPCPLLAKMVAAGRLGRKSGRGFFTYDEA